MNGENTSSDIFQNEKVKSELLGKNLRNLVMTSTLIETTFVIVFSFLH